MLHAINMSCLRFAGKVAVSLGAKSELGKLYPFLLRSPGWKVILNDCSGDLFGAKNIPSAVERAVKKIVECGGTAVVDCNPVVEGEIIIKTALDNYGRIDILIHVVDNYRDRSHSRFLDDNLLLNESFKITRDVVSIFQQRGYGRINMTASTIGLCENSVLMGLSNTIAAEGSDYNIHCNTRVSDAPLGPNALNAEVCEHVTAIGAYLCHEDCKENGHIIEVRDGWSKKIVLIPTEGAKLVNRQTNCISIENVRDNWHSVVNVINPQCVNMKFNTSEKSVGIDHPDVSSQNRSKFMYEYDHKDIITYALGVGTSIDRRGELKFLYEAHEEFEAFPTFYSILCEELLTTKALDVIPGKVVTDNSYVLGEYYLEVEQEIPLKGKMTSTFTISEVLDKGTGALVIADVNPFCNGKLCGRQQMAVFIRGCGNFGGTRKGKMLIECIPRPERIPDLWRIHKTTTDQSTTYRLIGHPHPIHIDPEFAKDCGVDKPTLHGLCTIGISVRLILGAVADYDCTLFKAVKVRCTKPVFPGQTLRVDMWLEGNRIHFETVVVETNTVVISGAYVDLKAIKMGTDV